MIETYQKRFNEIVAEVSETRLILQSHERTDWNAYLASAIKHHEALTKADNRLNVLSDELNSTMGWVHDKNHGNTTQPKRSDPCFKLLSHIVPYIIEFRREKAALKAWLDSETN